MSATNTAPDLNQVVAAVGQHLFSYLPTGSLLCGSASPMLVNRTFHEGVFQCLGQAKTLDLSCRHLRKVTDEQLIGLIRKIVDVGEASKTRDELRRGISQAMREGIYFIHPDAPPHPLKVSCLDLSRCRFLRGEGVFFCLKHMPGIKRILLSSATRFEAHHQFSDELNSDALEVKKLEYVDFAGCSRLDARGAMSFAGTIERCNLRHLNLSGVSAQLDDEALGVLAYFCNIESLNLAGARKITEFGAGLALYMCRGTLKSLNLRECDRVSLPNLLMDTARGIRALIEDNLNDDRLAIPPNYVGNPGSLPIFWLDALNNSTRTMMLAQPSLTSAQIQKSRLLMQGFKRAENDFSARMEWGERKEGSMFGCLEHLDISLIGQKTGTRLDGCLATIAWLNGGRLKHVDFDGLRSVLHSDLAVLSLLSPGLLSLSALSSATDETYAGRAPGHSPFLHGFFGFLHNVREINLSCCNWSSEDINMVGFFRHIRSLKIDFTNIDGGALQLLLDKLPHLLRLSIKGCSRLKSSHLTTDLEDTDRVEELGLIDLDLRELEMDVPLAEVKKVCPRLLRINSRCTPLGTTMLRAHRSAFLWRTGTSDNTTSKSKKRNRAGDSVAPENAPVVDTGAESSVTNSCSLLRTAFSSAKETEQEMYACRTCFVGSNRFVCLACAKRCHSGHDVFSVGASCGYCDCCIFSECKCLEGEAVEEAAGIGAELIDS